MIHPAPSLRSAPALLLLLLAGGCAHHEAFEYEEGRPDEPFTAGEPAQLTRSFGEDLYPTWTPNSTGIVFTYVDDTDGDRCLGQLGREGGQVIAHICPLGDPRNDSLNVANEAAPLPDGSLAWVELQNVRDRMVPDRGAIMLGRFGQPTARRLLTLPYLASTGNVHLTAAYMRWLPNGRLAYIGTDLQVRSTCYGCQFDTVPIGREAMLLDTRLPGAVPVPIPGTTEATSLWPTADSNGVYFTLAGDTRVWRREFGASQSEMVHDFGAAGIARDVSVRGNRLAAVVGGKVSYGFEASIGLRQVDSGGTVMTVDLTSGAEATVLNPINPAMYRRAVLSPDGRGLVAEGRLLPRQVQADLWLFHLP